jgi:Na+/melibiose symporter-like transporter
MKRKHETHKQSATRQWIEDNPKLAKALAAWLFFILEMVIAKWFGDFNNPYYIEFPKQQSYYTILLTFCLVILSIANIYGVPAFVKWIEDPGRKPATRLTLFGGLFLSFFCAPIAGASISLSVALFLTLTIVHTFGKFIGYVER